ncbi:MAG: alpha/beta fold hydrolase [Pseudomonadota bacterium]
MTGNSWDFASFDGVELKVHEMGEGRPIMLLHGLFSNAHTNWIKFGHAQNLASAGFHVIMPDLRAHGESGAPHNPESYPDDVLVRDTLALIGHLNLEDYDLGGFSLGARTTAKLLVEGATPRKAILAGMGLEGLAGWERRQDFFLKAIATKDTAKRGDPHWLAIQFMKSQKIDTVAAAYLLRTFSDLETGQLAEIETPVQVLCGTEDRDNGDPEKLAHLLPKGNLTHIPGTHMSSVTKAELGEGMLDFLSGSGSQ